LATNPNHVFRTEQKVLLALGRDKHSFIIGSRCKAGVLNTSNPEGEKRALLRAEFGLPPRMITPIVPGANKTR
jgi:hypothetical protein